jgi:hypothetical protein
MNRYWLARPVQWALVAADGLHQLVDGFLFFLLFASSFFYSALHYESLIAI